MSDRYPGTIKYKNNRRNVNIGIVICIIVVLYFTAYFCGFIFNRHSELYEVVPGNTSSQFDGQYTALILRSEKVVQAETSGYVNFFAGDAVPVYVGETTHMIDKSGELSKVLSSAAQTQAILNENDLTELKDSLYAFQTSFKPNEFYEAYHFRYQLESQILDLLNDGTLDTTVLANGSGQIFSSAYAGIIMHYADGFEELNTDTFEAASFRKSDYKKNIIRSNDYVEAGSPVYKVITSEDWELVLQISDPQAFQNLGNRLSVEFLKDNVKEEADFEIVTRGGNYYCIIYMDKYMIRYAPDRYTQVSLASNTKNGLKVPKSAVTDQVYFAIPVQYKSQGANSSRIGFNVKTKDENGNDTVVLRYPEIARQTEELYYISMQDPELKRGDVIVQNDSLNEFTVGMTGSISGVYIDNGGTVSFRPIETLGEIDGYYIVKDTTPKGVQVYDQVYVNYQDALKQ